MSTEKDYINIDMLRFTTAGSVDDGKSTLIGRLFHDTKSIFEDQLEAIEQSSRKRGDENVNLALLTDGLRAERERKAQETLEDVSEEPCPEDEPSVEESKIVEEEPVGLESKEPAEVSDLETALSSTDPWMQRKEEGSSN